VRASAMGGKRDDDGGQGDRRGARSARILDSAIHDLARRAPHWSAARRITPGQARALGIGAAIAALLGVLAPLPAGAAAVFIVTLGFSSLILFRLWAALVARPLPPPEPVSGDLPVYTILAPLYREARVAPALVAALEALDYPRALLDVKLVVEADDAETLAAVRACAPADFEIVETPAGGPRTKPKALTYALAFARGELLAIYDAEDRPHPAQLRAAVAAFARGGRDLVCVQAPLAFYNANENFLTRSFALEYAIHFRLVLPALLRMGAPIPLGGTSNHFRTGALRAAGGWDPYNVTEDADLGLRMAAMGGRLGMIAPPTLEEATCRLGPWIRQRSRWLKGYAQTVLVHTRARPGRPNFRKAATLWLTLGGALAAATMHGPTLIWLAAMLAWSSDAHLLAPALLSAGYCATLVGALRAASLSGDRTLIFAALLTPFYWPLQTVAAAIAFRQLWSAPYRWEKTEHGVSRAVTGNADTKKAARGEGRAAFPDRSAAPAAGFAGGAPAAEPSVPKA